MLLARRLSTQRAFVVRDEVRAAVAARRPVVALESTIITHGMPFPRNLEVARACEAGPRDGGGESGGPGDDGSGDEAWGEGAPIPA